MSVMVPASTDALGRLHGLLATWQNRREQLEREIAEIDGLSRQTTTEIDKLTQRESQINSRVRDAEINLDAYSRTDLRSLYGAAHEIEMRLFMMRSQLDQLHDKQRDLRRQLQELVEASDSLTSAMNTLGERVLDTGASSEAGATAPRRMTESGLQETVARLIEAQENERQRIAREMHDGPAQSMTNLILLAEICERLLESEPERARVELATLKSMVSNALKETRRFIFSLRPMILDDLGLVPTLRRYLQSHSEKHGIDATISVSGDERRLPPHVEVTAFRIIQEALDNVTEHANARRAQVALTFLDDGLSLTIEDDGNGFEVEQVLSGEDGERFRGLARMQQRADMLKGDLRVQSAPGKGTKVLARLPL